MTSPVDFSSLLPPHYEEEVLRWLRDDCPSFDVGGFVVGDKQETARLLCKQGCVLAGVPFVNAILRHLHIGVHWHAVEGAELAVDAEKSERVEVATLHGSCRALLLAERTCLNIISRASGVATAARRCVKVKETMKWRGEVAGTRKTTPGFRIVEKYALLVGGAATHRLDLSQMTMLKDNHIWSAGSITQAVQKARRAAGFSSKIEVECQSLEDAMEAADAGADIVMFDNYGIEALDRLEKDSQALKQKFPHVLIEASGGVTEDNLHFFMMPSVDIISSGSLTHGYECIDFSMKIATNK